MKRHQTLKRGIVGCPSAARAIESCEFIGRQIHSTPLAILLEVAKDIRELQRMSCGPGRLDGSLVTTSPNRQACKTDRASDKIHVVFEIADVADRPAINIPLVAGDLVLKVSVIDAKFPDRIRQGWPDTLVLLSLQ